MFLAFSAIYGVLLEHFRENAQKMIAFFHKSLCQRALCAHFP